MKAYLCLLSMLISLGMSVATTSAATLPFQIDDGNAHVIGGKYLNTGLAYGIAQDNGVIYTTTNVGLVTVQNNKMTIYPYPFGYINPMDRLGDHTDGPNWNYPNLVVSKGTVYTVVNTAKSNLSPWNYSVYSFHSGKWTKIYNAPANQVISALAISPTGQLDIGEHRTIIGYQNGKFTTIGKFTREQVESLTWNNSSLYVGTWIDNSTSGHLWTYHSGHWTKDGYGFSGDECGIATIAASGNNLAVSTNRDTWVKSNGRWIKLPMIEAPTGYYVASLAYSSDGILTAASFGGMFQYIGGKWVQMGTQGVKLANQYQSFNQLVSYKTGVMLALANFDGTIWRYTKLQGWQNVMPTGSNVLLSGYSEIDINSNSTIDLDDEFKIFNWYYDGNVWAPTSNSPSSGGSGFTYSNSVWYYTQGDQTYVEAGDELWVVPTN